MPKVNLTIDRTALVHPKFAIERCPNCDFAEADGATCPNCGWQSRSPAGPGYICKLGATCRWHNHTREL